MALISVSFSFINKSKWKESAANNKGKKLDFKLHRIFCYIWPIILFLLTTYSKDPPVEPQAKVENVQYLNFLTFADLADLADLAVKTPDHHHFLLKKYLLNLKVLSDYYNSTLQAFSEILN